MNTQKENYRAISNNVRWKSVRLIFSVNLLECLQQTHNYTQNMFLVIKFLFHCLLLLFHIWSCVRVFFFFFIYLHDNVNK